MYCVIQEIAIKKLPRTVDRIVSISVDVKIPECSIRREKAAEENRKFIQRTS